MDSARATPHTASSTRVNASCRRHATPRRNSGAGLFLRVAHLIFGLLHGLLELGDPLQVGCGGHRTRSAADDAHALDLSFPWMLACLRKFLAGAIEVLLRLLRRLSLAGRSLFVALAHRLLTVRAGP